VPGLNFSESGFTVHEIARVLLLFAASRSAIVLLL
jgi:hypothetical protein